VLRSGGHLRHVLGDSTDDHMLACVRFADAVAGKLWSSAGGNPTRQPCIQLFERIRLGKRFHRPHGSKPWELNNRNRLLFLDRYN
jgi:hypothetical protein